MTQSIRPFTNDDLDFALAQIRREGWDTTDPVLRAILSHDPGHCFVAEQAGYAVGMVTATRYQRSAWIGNLIVVPEQRRSGTGETLMTTVINSLEDAGAKEIWLEADPPGVGIYRRLGFIDYGESLRFRKIPPHEARSTPAEKLAPDEVAALHTLDERMFREDRRRMLDMLLDVSLTTLVVRERGQLVGYAMVLPCEGGVRFGPCVAESRETATALLDEVLALFQNRPIVVGVCAVDYAAELLTSRGFESTVSSLRMVRGDAKAVSAKNAVFAIANGAVG